MPCRSASAYYGSNPKAAACCTMDIIHETAQFLYNVLSDHPVIVVYPIFNLYSGFIGSL